MSCSALLPCVEHLQLASYFGNYFHMMAGIPGRENMALGSGSVLSRGLVL